MSKNVAVLGDNNKVINVIIVNDDYELNENEIIYTNENPAYIDGDYLEGYFYTLQPYPSWTRFEGNWLPPISEPNKGNWFWDEQIVNWVEA
jgi:hypothetical protein